MRPPAEGERIREGGREREREGKNHAKRKNIHVSANNADRESKRERESERGVCPDTRSAGDERGCGRMDDGTGAERSMAMYAVEADRWGCEAWPRYIVAEPLLKLLSVLLLSGNVGPRKCHFREIGRGPPRRRKYISRTATLSTLVVVLFRRLLPFSHPVPP